MDWFEAYMEALFERVQPLLPADFVLTHAQGDGIWIEVAQDEFYGIATLATDNPAVVAEALLRAVRETVREDLGRARWPAPDAEAFAAVAGDVLSLGYGAPGAPALALDPLRPADLDGDGIPRIAALYDVHGNRPALAAVLAEVEELDPDVLVLGGDLVAGGLTRATMELLDEISLDRPTWFVRGNAERDEEDFDLLWPDAAWRLSLSPAAAPCRVAGLGRTLFCHGSPRREDEIVTKGTPDALLAPMLGGLAVDTVVLGHTHHQFDRVCGGVRVVNPGSVGMPYEGRPGAYWALLGPDVELRRTEYDVERAAAELRVAGRSEFADVLLGPPTPAESVAAFEARARV